MPRFSQVSEDGDGESTPGKDWLDRHARFIEDFSKEGEQLKDEIYQKRDF